VNALVLLVSEVIESLSFQLPASCKHAYGIGVRTPDSPCAAEDRESRKKEYSRDAWCFLQDGPSFPASRYSSRSPNLKKLFGKSEMISWQILQSRRH